MEKGILDSRSGRIAVELFAIHCTTCRARLKVNEESAIGQILACPKCGSMVQVVPPIDWQRAGAAAAIVTPAAKPATAAPASVQEVWSAENSRPALPARAEATAAATATAARAPAGLPLKTTLTASTSKLAAAARVVVGCARRDWLALTSGIVLGTGVWLLIAMTSTSEPPDADAVGQISSELPRSRDVALNHADVEPTVPAEPDAAQVTDTTTEANEPAATSPPAPATAEPTAPSAMPPAVVAAPPAAEKPALPVATPAASPTVKLEPAPTVAVPVEEAEPADADAPSQVDTPAPEPPQIGAVPDRPGQSPGATPRMLSKSEIEDRLAQPLPTIEFPKTTLIHFVDFMQDLTGVPITIDEAALAKAGRNRQSPLTLKLSETTAGDALRAAAERLGLQVAVHNGKITITGPRD